MKIIYNPVVNMKKKCLCDPYQNNYFFCDLLITMKILINNLQKWLLSHALKEADTRKGQNCIWPN